MELAELVAGSVFFEQRNSNGFNNTKCPLCHDHKPRLGIKIDGDVIGASCFNCGFVAKYVKGERLSDKFRNLLVLLGVDADEIDNSQRVLAFDLLGQESRVVTLASLTKVNLITPEVALPPESFRLGNSDRCLDEQLAIAEYLIGRKIDVESYPFYFSEDPIYKNRVIIPYFRNKKIIYWQARSILQNEKDKRYINAAIGREAVMFNMDKLNSYSEEPLIVTEGVFDALIFDGVALLGSKLNAAKIELLKKSHRKLIFIIDKDKNGKHLAEQVLAEGWSISFSPEGTTDINNSAVRFGKIWTAYQIMKNLPHSLDESRLAININC